MKTMWRGLKSVGIWGEILKFKYKNSRDLEYIFMEGWNPKRGGSTIWNGFMHCWANMSSYMVWKFIWCGSLETDDKSSLENLVMQFKSI